jgi:hypothetical protein
VSDEELIKLFAEHCGDDADAQGVDGPGLRAVFEAGRQKAWADLREVTETAKDLVAELKCAGFG